MSEAKVMAEIPGYWRFEECGTVGVELKASGASSIERLWDCKNKAIGMEISRPNGVLIRILCIGSSGHGAR